MQREEHPAETPIADGTNPFEGIGNHLTLSISTYLDANAARNFFLETNNRRLRGLFDTARIDQTYQFYMKQHFPHWFNQPNKTNKRWIEKFCEASAKDYAKLKPQMAHLFASVKNGHLAAVKDFFIKNPTLSHEKTWLLKDGSGHALWYWVGRCSSQDVKDFYYEKMTTEDGEYLLHHAVIANQRDEIERLLSAPALDINSKNNRGNTPLFLAGCIGHAGYFNLLLETGANWLLRNADGNTPLAVATQQGHIGILESLTSLDSPRIPKDYVLNHYHAIQGSEDHLHNGGPGWVSTWASTLLMIATRAGHHDIMRLLLKNGARTELQDYDMRFSVDGEVTFGKLSALKQAYSHGFYPLLIAAINNDCAAIRLLLNHKAFIHIGCNGVVLGQSSYDALQFAAMHGCTEAAQLLLTVFNERPAPTEHLYISPLRLALESQHIGTAVCLLQHGLTLSDIEVGYIRQARLSQWKEKIIRHIEANISDEPEQARLLALTETIFSHVAEEKKSSKRCSIS